MRGDVEMSYEATLAHDATAGGASGAGCCEAGSDSHDPKINRSYAELAAHYGMLINPAGAGKPRNKSRAERPIPYCRDSFFRGRRFGSLEHLQTRRCAGAARSPAARAGRWTAPLR